MAGVGRDLWGSPSPSALLKQGLLERAARDLIQVGFEYLWRRRLHSPSGQPLPVLQCSFDSLLKSISYCPYRQPTRARRVVVKQVVFVRLVFT